MFINEGNFSVRTPDKLFSFKKGVAMLSKCFNFFFETTEEQRKKNETIEIVGIYLFPSILEEMLDLDLSLSNHTVDYNMKQLQLDVILNHYRESINLLLENPQFASEEIIKTKLKEFILLISNSLNAPSQLDFLAALFKPIHVEFKSTIEHNLYANLSIDELATLCHISTASFKRKFKSIYKESPKRYICKRKIEKAASLLKTSKARISNIAYDVGFDSVATFNRNFFSIFGKSPSEYRLS
ncbi:MAG: helix-turn-helix transcriptional regulator [Flavobacteriales bacterium]|nr:helix-turn-helix transcriptional regulator [Flavobacteriales bacterium]